ncbi:MAG: hypothetical protein R3F30_13755 [Planctomycetota bacterium]
MLSLVASAGQMLGLTGVLFGRVLWWRSQSAARPVPSGGPRAPRSWSWPRCWS